MYVWRELCFLCSFTKGLRLLIDTAPVQFLWVHFTTEILTDYLCIEFLRVSLYLKDLWSVISVSIVCLTTGILQKPFRHLSAPDIPQVANPYSKPPKPCNSAVHSVITVVNRVSVWLKGEDLLVPATGLAREENSIVSFCSPALLIPGSILYLFICSLTEKLWRPSGHRSIVQAVAVLCSQCCPCKRRYFFRSLELSYKVETGTSSVFIELWYYLWYHYMVWMSKSSLLASCSSDSSNWE